MMDENSPAYQTMRELQNDPEAMQAWRQQMRDNPEAMNVWMKQVHGEDFANRHGEFGCHGGRFGSNNRSE
jgi:copper oxidase (laccase) domain-containing protein